jgi:hypothetical protein
MAIGREVDHSPPRRFKVPTFLVPCVIIPSARAWRTEYCGYNSHETVKYGREFCEASTQEWLLWQGPEAIVPVNYRPVLSSERALQNNKPATVWRKFQGERKIGRGSQLGAWHQGRLADWLSVINFNFNFQMISAPHTVPEVKRVGNMRASRPVLFLPKIHYACRKVSFNFFKRVNEKNELSPF